MNMRMPDQSDILSMTAWDEGVSPFQFMFPILRLEYLIT